MKQFLNKRNAILVTVILLVSTITIFGIIEDKRGIFHNKEYTANNEPSYEKQEHEISALTKDYKTIKYKISYVLIYNQNNKTEINEEMFRVLNDIRQFMIKHNYKELIRNDYKMIFENISYNKRLNKLKNNNKILIYNLEIYV